MPRRAIRPRSARCVRDGAARLAVHLAERPRHPVPLDLPARRVADARRLGKLVFQQGKVDVDFVGFSNFTNLLFGTERTHFLGVAPDADAARLGDPDRRRGPASSGRCSGACGAVASGVGRRDRPRRRRAASAIGLVVARRPDAAVRGRPARDRSSSRCSTSSRASRSTYVPRPRPGDPRGPAAPWPAVLPGRVPAAADDHADRRRLHVPDDDRHREGPARAALGCARADATTRG